jgi:anti-sigma factor ChrR (cupin superfamily)
MITERQQEQASLFALEALPPQEAQSFAADLLADSELRDLVREFQSTAALLARSAPSIPLPANLKDKVLRRIDHAEAPFPVGLNFIQAAHQTGWKPLPIPGAFIQLLSIDRERGYAVLLGKLAPGARYPAHVNAGPEDFYILTGDLVIGDRKLVAGDFHHADRGSHHEENYSIAGCTLLAVLTTDDPLVAFAMS